LNPTAFLSYAYFYSTNQGTPTIPSSQVGDFFGYSGNVNPFNGQLLQVNEVDPDLKAPTTDELLFGVEHALRPEFVIGLNLTYRQITDILESELLVFEGDAYSAGNINSNGRPHRRSDYVRNQTTSRTVTLADGTRQVIPFVNPDGTPYTLVWYSLNPALSTRNGGFLENGDREQEYMGVSAVFNKRLANRWMLRGNFTWSDWEWSSVPDSELENPTRVLGGGRVEGDPVLQGSGNGSGAKGGIYINSEWAYSVSGLYQISPDRPWGFNVALAVNGRQGYPIPYFHRVTLGANQQSVSTNIQTTPEPDTFRLDDIHMVDARVEKEFSFSDFGLTLGVDCFNLFNKSYVLQRNHRQNQTTSDFVREIISPRVIRFGARLSFR
jgi:hypothetical protein